MDAIGTLLNESRKDIEEHLYDKDKFLYIDYFKEKFTSNEIITINLSEKNYSFTSELGKLYKQDKNYLFLPIIFLH